MFFEQTTPDIQNNLDYPLKPRQHQTAILSFLRQTLPEVAKSLVRTGASILPTLNENDITGEISNLLNDRLRSTSSYLFRFEAQSGPDILMFASPYKTFSRPLFVIEAKRLPSTSSRDYVLTGIRRFKTEEHGKDHDYAAMLGYIQAQDCDHWHNTINGWIDDLTTDRSQKPRWENQDKLNCCCVNPIGEYKSVHRRKERDPITIYHFWLDFTNN